MHPTDFDLLAHLHAEAGQPGAGTVRRHLETCRACFERRQELGREESEQRRLLRALDAPVPLITVEAIRRRSRVALTGVRIAASIALLVTLASAAAAIPGSPVRAWLRRLTAPAARPPAQPPAVVPQPAASTDGVQVAATGSLVIMLGTPQRTGQIRIVRTDLVTATVRAVGGDVGYRIGAGRIILDNRLPADRYDITIPRALERFVLLAGGRVLLRIDARHPPGASDTLTIELARRGGTSP